MLLTVIDLIESGDVPDGWVKFDVRLVSRFREGRADPARSAHLSPSA
jgi:hypothetical protein